MSKPNFEDDLEIMKSGATEIFHSIPEKPMMAEDLTDLQIVTITNHELPKHINCLKEGGKILIDTTGIWCSTCEPDDYTRKV